MATFSDSTIQFPESEMKRTADVVRLLGIPLFLLAWIQGLLTQGRITTVANSLLVIQA